MVEKEKVKNFIKFIIQVVVKSELLKKGLKIYKLPKYCNYYFYCFQIWKSRKYSVQKNVIRRDENYKQKLVEQLPSLF